jgi:putative DNA-invertase from lambdoid prophage Rac
MGMGVLPDNIFEDHGSGATEPRKRTEYIRLLKFIDENEVDELIISEYSRIGRTVVDSLIELLQLVKRGLKVSSLAVHEDMINSIPPEFQPGVIGLMMGSAQKERERIRERTRWGLDNAREKGKTLGRPSVEIDFNKVNETMVKYNLKERQAVRVIGYKESTFYAAKRKTVRDK